MNWKIDRIEEGNIMLVKMLGPVDLEGMKQLCKEGVSFAREHQSKKYLLDHRGVDIGMSIPNIDKLPDLFREIEVNFEAKTAIIIDPPTEGTGRFGFVKDVLAKAWMHLELFTDEDKAIAWLKST